MPLLDVRLICYENAFVSPLIFLIIILKGIPTHSVILYHRASLVIVRPEVV